MKSLIIIISWIGLANFSHALSTCDEAVSNILLSKDKPEKPIELKGDTFIGVKKIQARNENGELEEISNAEVESVLKVAYDVNDLLVNGDDYLIRPRGLQLHAYKTVYRPYFNQTGEKYLNVGEYFENKFGESSFVLTKNLTKNVTAHEYGHAIFDINMLKHLLGTEDFMKVLDIYDEKVGELDTAFQQIYQHSMYINQIFGGWSPGVEKYMLDPERGILAQKIGFQKIEKAFLSDLEKLPNDNEMKLDYYQVNEELEKWYEEFVYLQRELEDVIDLVTSSAAYQNYEELSHKSLAYNELFADLTAVLYAKNNPKAISDALETVSETEIKNGEQARSSYRDFSDPSNDISRWSPTEAPHDLFAPTRYYLYTKYLSKEFQGKQGKRRLYKAVFMAIRNELSYQYFNPTLILDPTDWNKRLMAEISRLMKG